MNLNDERALPSMDGLAVARPKRTRACFQNINPAQSSRGGQPACGRFRRASKLAGLRIPVLQTRPSGNARHVSSFRALARALGASLATAAALICTPRAHAGYTIENVKYPAEIRGGISAVTFTPSGQLVVATRLGEVWIRSATANASSSADLAQWRLFTRGLDEPMGLIADSDRLIYIAHRPELL